MKFRTSLLAVMMPSIMVFVLPRPSLGLRLLR